MTQRSREPRHAVPRPPRCWRLLRPPDLASGGRALSPWPAAICTKREQTMAIVNGTSSADSLYGTNGADTINGLGGNDTLKGMGGADRLDGGAGIDTAFYSDSSVGVNVNLATGRGLGGTAEGDTLVNVEN